MAEKKSAYNKWHSRRWIITVWAMAMITVICILGIIFKDNYNFLELPKNFISIDNSIFLSPSNYLLSLNITLILDSLNIGMGYLENWLEKIIGTNYNEVKGFISAHSFSFLQKSIVQVYWRSGEGNVFLNTFGQLFFKYGLIGFLLFMIPLVKYLRNKLFEAKPFVIMMMFAIFGQTMLLNSYYFMNIMLVVLFSKVTSSEANLLNESEVKAV